MVLQNPVKNDEQSESIYIKKCGRCGDRFKTLADLKNHFSSVHGKSPSKNLIKKSTLINPTHTRNKRKQSVETPHLGKKPRLSNVKREDDGKDKCSSEDQSSTKDQNSIEEQNSIEKQN